MAVLRDIEHFLARAKMAPTRFGREVVNDPRLVLDMRNGREPRPTTVAKIRSYIGEMRA
ncbi:MAG: hypothetical protein ACKVOB_02030 [Sphingomonas sp.]